MRETATRFDLCEAGPGCLLMKCNGGLSWEDRELLAASVEDYIADRDEPVGVVIDMIDVRFVNSAGLGALFQLVQRLRGRCGLLALANVAPMFVRLFEAVGLDRVAKVADDVPAALALVAKHRAEAESSGTDPKPSH